MSTVGSAVQGHRDRPDLRDRLARLFRHDVPGLALERDVEGIRPVADRPTLAYGIGGPTAVRPRMTGVLAAFVGRLKAQRPTQPA